MLLALRHSLIFYRQKRVNTNKTGKEGKRNLKYEKKHKTLFSCYLKFQFLIINLFWFRLKVTDGLKIAFILKSKFVSVLKQYFWLYK